MRLYIQLSLVLLLLSLMLVVLTACDNANTNTASTEELVKDKQLRDKAKIVCLKHQQAYIDTSHTYHRLCMNLRDALHQCRFGCN